MNSENHYLKNELYDLVKSDSSIFEFLQNCPLDGLWYWDLENIENEWLSPQFWKTLGYDPAEKKHLASEWQDLIHADDLKNAIENFNKHCIDPNHPYDQIVRYRHKNGSTVWVRCRGIAIRNKNGKPIRMLGAHNELTQLKKTEEKYRLIFNMGVDAMFLVDDNTAQVLDCNAKASQLFGYTPQELLSMKMIDLSTTPEATRRACLQDVSKQERIYQTKDGRLISVEITSEHFYLANRAVHISAIRDITEKKNAEKALKESEERYNLAMDASRDGIYEWDLETRKIYYSPGWKRMLGYKPDELPDDFSVWEKLTRPEDVEKSWQIMKEVVEGKRKRFEMEFEMRHKDGHWVHILSRSKLYKDINGKPVRVIGTHVDITDSKRYRERLRRNESRYRKAQELGKVGNWEYNLKTTEFWGSDEAKKIFGFDLDKDNYCMEEVENCIIERERVHQALVDLIENEKPYNLEFEIITKNTGKIKHIVSIAELEKNVVGNPVKVSGVIQDITEQKQAEKSRIKYKKDLEDRNYFIQTILDNLPIGLAVNYIEEGSATYMNKKFEEIYGWPKQQLENIGEFFHKIYPDPEYRKKIMKQISDDIKSSDPERMVWEGIEITRKDGEKRIISAKNIALYEQNLMISTVQDITDRKRAEKALRHNHEMLKLTEAMANIGSWDWDVQHDQTCWSEELFRIFGRDSAVGAPPFAEQSELYGNGDMQRLRDAVDNCIKRGKSYEIELRAIRPDDEIRYCISRGQPQYDENGEVSRITGSFQDITERKQAEEEHKKLQNQLSQAQKMESVGRLAGGVAHDFNNMLGVILGHTELALLQADENQDLYSDLIEIQKAAKRSADITKQLLAFARKQTISPKPLNLNDTVESMLNMLRRLIGENIDLIWRPSAHLWQVKIDPSQIDQILANLCINARDAISGVGKIIIETGKKTFNEEYCRQHSGFIPGNFVLLAISDNGCGMDMETLDNLFEPFFTTKEVGKGTGLGLATVYGIVKQNNGFINVYSELGQGSTFRIYLPQLVADGDTDKTVPDKKAVTGGTETILLVEDEPSILRMTRMMLERKGYAVLYAATPLEAVEKANNHSGAIELLMTDVVMPEMNGRDLAVQITNLYPDIRLLFMSGYTANVIAHQGILDDGVAFIQKPFSMAEMTAKVRELLDMASDKNKGYLI